MTPYFLPDSAVVSALIWQPCVVCRLISFARTHRSAVRLWASRAMWSQVLQHGCRIWLTCLHSITQTHAGGWLLGAVRIGQLGFAELTPNFEFNVECYDVELAQQLDQWIETKRNGAHPVTMERSMAVPCRLACATALRDCYRRTYKVRTYVWTKPFGKERDYGECDE